MVSSSRILSAAVAVCALALPVWSGDSQAATFTLQQLYDGETFFIGTAEFRDFSPVAGGDFDPEVITLETIESGSLIGFTVNGNEAISGPGDLGIEFSILELDPRKGIESGVLYLSDIFAEGEAEYVLDLEDCTSQGDEPCTVPASQLIVLQVMLDLPDEPDDLDPVDAGRLNQFPPAQVPLELRSRLDQVKLNAGAIQTNNYAIVFSSVARPAECGNGLLEAGEQCDPPDGVLCDDSCQNIPVACGNDIRQATEECDGIDDSACSGECQGDCSCLDAPAAYCGDGVVDAGEACDGADDDACPNDCRLNCECGLNVCTLRPDPICIGSGTASLTIDEREAGKEFVEATLGEFKEKTKPEDFGDPADGATAYELCLYDEEDLLILPPLRVNRAGDLCGPDGVNCWKAKDKGPRYEDQDQASSGVELIVAKSGKKKAGSLEIDASNNSNKGRTSLPTGLAAKLAGATKVSMQVRTSDAACFNASLKNVKKSKEFIFQGKK